MALLPAASENAGIQAILVPGTTYYIAFNSATPGTTGANELASGTRQAIVFTTATNGVETNTAAIAYPNPGTVAATHCSIWTAATGGSYVWGAPLGSPVTAASITVAVNQGSFSLS